jgi:S-adenosylmethionine hydrolase
MGVSADLKLYDLTEEIPPNIWEAAYRLEQDPPLPFWPVGTVFVSVVNRV